jgi:hypothetical protein
MVEITRFSKTLDLGETLQITLGTTDPVTGASVNPSSVACVVIRPSGNSDSVTLANVTTGLYRGFYSTTEAGTHGGKITSTYAGSITVIDRFEFDVDRAFP